MEIDTLSDIEKYTSNIAGPLTSVCSALKLWPRRRVMQRLFGFIAKKEKGIFFSPTIRRWLAAHYGVQVGSYSYGPCLTPGGFPSGVRVGRYVSIANGVKVTLQNKPMDRLSMHPLFYELDDDAREGIQYASKLVIEHDAWIGDSALILPGCARIGLSAVIGAGSVVTRDVDDFAVVAGNPAKLLRYRLDDPAREAAMASKWWEKSFEELSKNKQLLTTRYQPGNIELAVQPA